MDEEVGVKVTRLRRRLSVESEGAQSPATPSTPTKKRSTRLAKPALELIDENATENVPKRATRKSISRDVEPAEEKPVTPARRSTRIRSNTSLILEAPIVAESPRAKRALRRTSQLGSDTESITTPVKPNRRTRKASTSSVEKLAVTNTSENVPALVADPIAGEPEKDVSKLHLSASQSPSPVLRKSPRIHKKDRKSIIDEALENNNEKQSQKHDSTSPKKTVDDTVNSLFTEASANVHDNLDNKQETKDAAPNISLSSVKLINEMDNKTKLSPNLNKSTSSVEVFSNEKNRKRTKSWTTMTNNLSTDDVKLNNLGSGDSLVKNKEKDVKSPNRSLNKSNLATNSLENKENIHVDDTESEIMTVKLLQSAPSKEIEPIVFMDDSDSNSGKLVMDIKHDKTHYNASGDQCVPVAVKPKRASESFNVEPMDIDETIPDNVTIDDFSDKTNSSREEENEQPTKRKSSVSYEPAVNASSNKSKRNSSISLQQELNNSKRKSSIGPEDYNNTSKTQKKSDKSISDRSQEKFSISNLDDTSENANKSRRKSSLTKSETENEKRKSSLSLLEDNSKNKEHANKSNTQSCDGELQNLEKTSNENKSTLVLSQLKDVSANESSVSKSLNDTNGDLSKSVTAPIKATDKKNLDQNYQTSTPLQQKSIQKLAMQINTSMISPNVENKNTSKSGKLTPKNNSKVSEATENSDSDSSEDESRNSNIDDEAEEASDDYESGDSRSDTSRRYEKENEIGDKGDTIGSEESSDENNSEDDYEKDSFVVSSNEEDNELLSGTDDDLSLSDNELKMTSKSKKKFDERKRKQQKNASKEMYEARHGFNESDNSTKIKKSKRQRLESSTIESEKEDTQPKKKIRLRIDSSQDGSLNDSYDISVCAKKKKRKRLSESQCESTEVNEKEITICNQSIAENNDPLTVAVKAEPKTPQKDLNISTVQIKDNIEEVHVDGNMSMMKANETKDPLQATLAQEDEDASDSDISENMEIRDNYDSVLDNLMKVTNQKIKTAETSLNLNKKTKNKKEPVIDELNLTQVKISKKNKSNIVEKNKVSEEPEDQNNDILSLNDEGEQSDSIDMKLLFPEDSNDSEINSNFKPVESEEKIIPLKKSEAKTNICDSIGHNSSKNESPNMSKKKNKNRNSSQQEPTNVVESEDTHLGFFIDTKGTYEEIDTFVQNSAKKNKKHKQNTSMNNTQNDLAVPDIKVTESTPVNVSLKSDKKKKKHKSINASQIEDEPAETPMDISIKSDKRNKSDTPNFEETPLNVSVKGDKKKKKNKSHNISQTEESGETSLQILFEGGMKNTSSIEEMPENISLISIKKKKKSKSLEASQIVDDFETEELLNVSKNNNKKKKKKNKNQDVSVTTDMSVTEEAPVNISVASDKKKKKKNKAQNIVETTETEALDDTYTISRKKKKKKKDKTSKIFENTALDVTPTLPTKKKKKKKVKLPEVYENTEPIEEPIPVKIGKKKKKKSRNVSQDFDNTGEDSDDAPMEVSFRSEKKSDVPEPEVPETVATSKNKFKKKKKKSKAKNVGDTNQQDASNSNKRKRDIAGATSAKATDDEINLNQNNKRKIYQNADNIAPSRDNIENSKNVSSKKRKATEEIYGSHSKMFKENSFDKIPVPRLPDSVVSQLHDGPIESKKQKKPKSISTVPFQVDDGPRRKNKPSNYLEQSIYLNDSPKEKAKLKRVIKNPKVLPFVPTAITSGKGYTTNFRINVIPEDTQFVAQVSDLSNFKNDFLNKQRIKKFKKFEVYKRHLNSKLSKF